MSELPLCGCAERRECEAKGGFRWWRPAAEWFLEGELRELANSDRQLATLLDLERRRRLGPAQSAELREQRRLIRENFSTLADAAAGRPMATHRCRLYRESVEAGIQSQKAASRMDDDDRRMM